MKQIDDGKKNEGRERPKAGIFEKIRSALPDSYEKYVVPAAVGIVLLTAVIYAVSTAMPEKSPDDVLPDVPGTEQSVPSQETGTDVGTGGSPQDPFNDGVDILPDGDGQVGDGFDGSASAYWIVTPKTREKTYRLQVPAGWSAQAVTGGIRVKPEGFDEDAQGAEAVAFWWGTVDDFRALSEDGRIDMLARHPNPGYEADFCEVTDAWLTDDGQGGQWPVYVVRHVVKYAPGGELSGQDVDEYRFFVAKPHKNGDTDLYFVGTAGTDAFQAMRTPRFETVESLVRAMFPPSGEMDVPSGDAGTGDAGTQPDGSTGDADATAAGPDGEPAE